MDNDGALDDAEIEYTTSLIDLNSYPVNEVLNVLLQDKTTKKNIIWATDSYYSSDHKCKDKDQIKIDVFRTGIPVVLRPRSQKDSEDQQQRTRKKAEVFTPEWICNQMNNRCDEEWFGRNDIFNHMNEDNIWTVTETKIVFSSDGEWKNYVDSRRLEITCGEAPFIVSRYDATTGELIYPLYRRTGILDRKLRIVSENTDNLEDWTKWVVRAFQSCYGYEWQGDNLLIARINLLMTFFDYYKDRWESDPEPSLLKQIANIITWNFWQMNGLKDTVPFGKPYQEQRQMTLFDSFEETTEVQQEDTALPCKIYDWRCDNSLQFKKIKKVGKMSKKLFDFVIGNPPYQDENVGDQKTYRPPIYHLFLDSAYVVAERVMMIHPARFLFRAGKTPREWNEKMLSDPHLRVIMYEEDASKIFPNTDIKGGIAVTFRDSTKISGPIKQFIANPLMRSIADKVIPTIVKNMSDISYSSTSYKFTQKMHDENPDVESMLSDGHKYDIESNTVDKLKNLVFWETKPKSEDTFVQILGMVEGKRKMMWVKEEYIKAPNNFDFYKVILPNVNGTGALGEAISKPMVAGPKIGHSRTFMSIGCFKSEFEANACLSYIKTKFARCMLGTLKITHHNPINTWENIPLQSFTKKSDIDWTKSVKDIDQQLYQKYNLSDVEVQFIENTAQEME